MLELKRESMSIFIKNAHAEIGWLWDELILGNDKRGSFAPFVDSEPVSFVLFSWPDRLGVTQRTPSLYVLPTHADLPPTHVSWPLPAASWSPALTNTSWPPRMRHGPHGCAMAPMDAPWPPRMRYGPHGCAMAPTDAYQWPTHGPHASHAIFLIGYPNKIGPTAGEDPALTLGYTLGYPQEKKLKPVPDLPNRRRVPYPSGPVTLG